MKTISISIIVFLITICTNAYSQKVRLDSVMVQWEHFGTETVVAVSCDQFDTQFIKSKQSKRIYSPTILSRLKKISQSSYFKKSKEWDSIDVRGKIVYFYSNSTVKYCFDASGHFGKNGVITDNKLLWNFITSRIIPKAYQ
ncbi:hypothetical protein SAMN05428975_1542 [Mucilaginibacter sp. OK268]|uniref:hypothetical protein n=1 Tax=Mucilaginibacter sp. OK268 TaxID=1881048 RepID=UPI00088D7661|nr:hypothetical protein [Mucilaginibacter sp. OK268]SDP51192.1 hypothetical protein SAMN05428975_1542 [Mucilaginibacter sp. OK268]